MVYQKTKQSGLAIGPGEENKTILTCGGRNGQVTLYSGQKVSNHLLSGIFCSQPKKSNICPSGNQLVLLFSRKMCLSLKGGSTVRENTRGFVMHHLRRLDSRFLENFREIQVNIEVCLLEICHKAQISLFFWMK